MNLYSLFKSCLFSVSVSTASAKSTALELRVELSTGASTLLSVSFRSSGRCGLCGNLSMQNKSLLKTSGFQYIKGMALKFVETESSYL